MAIDWIAVKDLAEHETGRKFHTVCNMLKYLRIDKDMPWRQMANMLHVRYYQTIRKRAQRCGIESRSVKRGTKWSRDLVKLSKIHDFSKMRSAEIGKLVGVSGRQVSMALTYRGIRFFRYQRAEKDEKEMQKWDPYAYQPKRDGEGRRVCAICGQRLARYNRWPVCWCHENPPDYRLRVIEFSRRQIVAEDIDTIEMEPVDLDRQGWMGA